MACTAPATPPSPVITMTPVLAEKVFSESNAVPRPSGRFTSSRAKSKPESASERRAASKVPAPVTSAPRDSRCAAICFRNKDSSSTTRMSNPARIFVGTAHLCRRARESAIAKCLTRERRIRCGPISGASRVSPAGMPVPPGTFRLTRGGLFRVCRAMQKRGPLRAGVRSLIFLVGAACVLAGCQTAPPPTASNAFRVMTYNIHHGEGLDGKVDLLRIAELIKREGADIVALQEVDKSVERTARRDFPDELAALTGMTCVFSNNYHFQGGEYGNAVLTRFPVKRWTNTHFKKVNETEQRGILQLLLEVQGREVVFMATHIDHRPDDAARWSMCVAMKTT